MVLTNWLVRPIFKGGILRADRYREETPGEVDRHEQIIMEDHFNLQQVRLFHWGGIISDITYGPSRPVDESRRRTKQHVIIGRGGWGAHFPMDGHAAPNRIPSKHKRARRRIRHRKCQCCTCRARQAGVFTKNAQRNETEALRRRQGRYHRKRHIAQEELRRQYPYAQQPTWEELQSEVKACREHINYDSDQEESNAHDTIRISKYAAYEKRQEMRRREKKP